MQLSPATWPTLSKLLDEALDLEGAARDAWLHQLTASQPNLGPVMRQMLAMHASRETADVMASLPQMRMRLHAPRVATLASGDRVGPYRLKRELGAGGMADVWLAERADGAFARDVALKIPLVSRLRRDLAQRFTRERDILARLEHPHIARLYDGGVSRDGVPYLAMEYVDGQPITEYCDAKQLDVAARLKLFLQVLEAVQYAHANLIIHRDLKPSNILVTAEGQVRLLDFGIAKLLADDDTARETQLTHMAGRALTPDYASPEQVKGEPLTIATDIYSLGVVLYELLAGSPPYKLKVRSAAHLEQAIVEIEPKRPSSAVDSAAARARSSSASRLMRALAGDLDTIVLKSLAKLPEQRYATVAGFAADLQRHLQGQPVSARPAAWTYRVRKFVARNRVVTGAAGAAVLALIIGSSVAGWQAQQARAEQRRAEQVKAFLASIFVDIDPTSGQGSRVPASSILLKASNRIDNEFGNEPRLALEVTTLVVNGLLETNEIKTGSEVIRSALQRYQGQLSPLDSQVLRARTTELRAHASTGTLPQVASQLPDLITKLRTANPPLTEELVFTLICLGTTEALAKRPDSAATVMAEAAEISISRLGEQHKSSIQALQHWANMLLISGNPAEARAVAQRGVEAARAAYKRPHPVISDLERRLAVVLLRSDRPRDAAVLSAQVLEDETTIYGEGTVPVARAQYSFGHALAFSGKLTAALEHMNAGLEALVRLTPSDHRNHWVRRSNVAAVYLAARRPEQAIRVLDEADQAGAVAGVDTGESTVLRRQRAMALTRLGRFADATSGYSAIHLIEARASNIERARTARGLALLARLQDRPADAIEAASSALAGLKGPSVTVHERAATRLELGLGLLEKGDFAAADDALRTSRSEFTEAQVELSPDVLDVELGLARIALLQGKTAEAVALLSEGLNYWRGLDPSSIDLAAFEYWHARASAVKQSAATIKALRSSPYPLHRKWIESPTTGK